MNLGLENMNHKKNVDDWIEYVRANWLNRKREVQFRPSTERLIHKMRQLSLDSSNFGDAWHYVEEIEKLQRLFRDDTRAYPRESPQMLLECGLASYTMGNSREAIRYLIGAIGFYNEDHDRAVARWLLGCVYWHLEDEVDALSAWENAMQDFREQAKKIEKNKDEVQWYTLVQKDMKDAIQYAVDHNAPPPPPPPLGRKSKNNDKKHLLQDLPVIGQIPAGTPLGILPNASDFMEVDQVILENKKHNIVSLLYDRQVVNLSPKENFYVLHVRGNSMNQATPEPIEDGDYVILHQQNTAASGDIVAVEIVGVDDRATLKRVKIDSSTISLMPESMDPEFKKPMYLNHVFTKLDIDFHIRGVAIAVLKPI
jgi:SOS-response transcriptional repressor LexA